MNDSMNSFDDIVNRIAQSNGNSLFNAHVNSENGRCRVIIGAKNDGAFNGENYEAKSDQFNHQSVGSEYDSQTLPSAEDQFYNTNTMPSTGASKYIHWSAEEPPQRLWLQ